MLHIHIKEEYIDSVLKHSRQDINRRRHKKYIYFLVKTSFFLFKKENMFSVLS